MNKQSILVFDKDGNKWWLLNGEFHREDGPAVEWVSGYKAWCINGIRHRTDGPAIIYPNGDKTWWINGWPYLFEEWFQILTPEQQYDYLWSLDG
jgi:hypothetical protein